MLVYPEMKNHDSVFGEGEQLSSHPQAIFITPTHHLPSTTHHLQTPTKLSRCRPWDPECQAG